MSKTYRLYQIDSFTKHKFTGNPAGVITNAEGLTEEQMQKIARELNNSETAFIFPSNTEDYDVLVRFFTPANEVPICGHATIAAHYAIALENNFDTVRVFQKTGAGILPVDVIKQNDDYQIIMTQGRIEFGDLISGAKKEALLKALKITEADLMSDYPVQIVSTGHSKVMIGLKSRKLLNELKPDYDALADLSELIGCNGYYPFTFNPEDEVPVNGRMFAPAIGIKEDPVTGNANGPLGAYLVKHNLVRHNGSLYHFKARQGEVIERTGIIDVEVEIEKDEPVKVRISGNAVVVFHSELTIE